MPRLGSNRNKNLSRANSIISSMQETEEVTPAEETIEENNLPEETPNEQVEDNTPEEVIPEESATPEETPEEVIPEEVSEERDFEITNDLIFNKLSETLGREIKSFEDLETKEDLDEELKQLKEWKQKTGLSLSKWADYNKDFSQMSDLEVARETLAAENPNFTKEELEYTLKDFIYDEMEDDESDRIGKSIALKKFAKKGRETLEQNKINLLENQKNLSLSKEDKELLDFAKSYKEQEAKNQSNEKDYSKSLAEEASKLGVIEIDLGEGLKINHKVSDESKKALKNYMDNMPDWYNEDGSFNHSNIARDSYKLQNFNSILKSVYEQGRSSALEEKIKGDNNISLDSNGLPQDGVSSEKSNINEVVRSITGKTQSKFRFRQSKK